MGTKKTPLVPAVAALRVRVTARSGKPIVGATVSLDSPAATVTTDAAGSAKFTLKQTDIDALSPAGQVTLRAKKRHHGPDPGSGGKVAPGEVKVTPQVTIAGFDPGTAGLEKDAKGDFLALVLVDAGWNQGATTLGTVTRRLTAAEVQRELMFYHHNDELTLSPDTEFEFAHDPASGEFDACDAKKCALKRPKVEEWVGLKSGTTLAGVTFFYLSAISRSAKAKSDVVAAQHFVREQITWAPYRLRTVDQRHLVGLARMCKKLAGDHGVTGVYTQGINGDSSRADCHGYGLAIDFGGGSTELPDDKARVLTVRLGVDFIVDLHWGAVPMWDRTTVAVNPGDSSTWTRLAKIDDNFDYATDRTGATSKLHYRLDPAPFQDAIPAFPPDPKDPDLATKLGEIAPHFVTARELFRAVYDFAVEQYSDSNTGLGPLPAKGPTDVPTAIDAHDGHFILHPDYGQPTTTSSPHFGRGAHANHLHFQLGPTSYKGVARTK